MFSWNLFLVILCHLPRKAGWTVWKNSQRTHHIHIMWPIGNFVWRWHPQAQQKTWKPWECICTKTGTVGSQGPHQHQCCHKPSTVQTLPQQNKNQKKFKPMFRTSKIPPGRMKISYWMPFDIWYTFSMFQQCIALGFGPKTVEFKHFFHNFSLPTWLRVALGTAANNEFVTTKWNCARDCRIKQSSNRTGCVHYSRPC